MKLKNVLALFLIVFLLAEGVAAYTVSQQDTPNYKVAFYAHENYHIMDHHGKRSGYGYEMMEALTYYLQATFSYVGYDKTAVECEELLRSGELDLYTAARKTPEREQEFAFSRHPAITATTYLTVKVGNARIVAGDYATYEGIKVGSLEASSYNENFIAWAEDKGFSYEMIYFKGTQEATEALIAGEVDALLNSYIRLPDDELVIETFGETPYYIMARKEDQALIDEIDRAIDRMNVEMSNWRTTLFHKYYGTAEHNTELTASEQALLEEMQKNGTVIRGVTNPDNNPYSWYQDGTAYGIAVDIFKATAEELGLDYEIVEAQTRVEYQRYLADGGVDVDIWMDVNGYYSGEPYKLTDVYLNTSASLLRRVSASGKIQKIAVVGEITVDKLEIIEENWPEAKIIAAKDLQTCTQIALSGEVDGVLLLTYTAQKLVQDDIQNRLRADIVPGVTVELRMGVNAQCDRDFCGIWRKTLEVVARQINVEVVQTYTEQNVSPSFLAFLFDNPIIFVVGIFAILFLIGLLLLYIQAKQSNGRYQRLAAELELALTQAREATRAKEDFFSKMSHDIRTPLNVVLGMTQVAQKYRKEPTRLQYALDNITSEGSYLLVLINSILDVNQLEHGHIELNCEPFAPAVCVRANVEILRTLAESKSQRLSVICDREDEVVVGDANRYSQIIINIVSNAIKYTNPGGHIDIALETLPDHRFRFICRDDGIGMTEEFVQHITEEYTRAEDSRVSKRQGTGLGMAVVRGFVDLMGGTLQIDTAPEQGSTFIVEVPFARATPEQCKRILDPAPVEEITGFAGKKALLAEDNALNAEIATELLQSIGFEVDWAENGKLAYERLMASTPGTYSVIFMDMQMPVMDGVTATREIRACAHPDHNILIFAMTANTFADDRKLCSEAGMNGHIAKPINITEIAAALKSGENYTGGKTDGGETA